MAQFISEDKKQQIIHDIRDEGKRVVDVSIAHNVSTKTIYHWLKNGIAGDRRGLEIARLKRELVQGHLGCRSSISQP
ncbi:MAG TPA: helix-turn-helix domain-containing protein [Ktedonobacteraceae bacterium]|nr:helix-turn-helix domain-containing protein [Ktedonobacteraceae bacterium]